MEFDAAMTLARPLRATGTAVTAYELGPEGLIRAGPGNLAGCPQDICIWHNVPGATPRPPDHNSYFRDLDLRRLHPGFAGFMQAAEDVFSGGCPLEAARRHLAGYRDAPGTTFAPTAWLCLLQLFLVEQDLNYGPGGRFTLWSPPSGFHMEYVRWVAAGTHPLAAVFKTNKDKGRPQAFPEPPFGTGRTIRGPQRR